MDMDNQNVNSRAACCCEPVEKPEHSCCCQTTDANGNVRTKHRSEAEYRKLMNRLKRIEGQIHGIQRMLENEAYCPDILIQVSAVNAALNGFNKELLASHLRSCVVSDIKSEDQAVQEGAVDELVELLRKLMK
jgi:DNA-binding FrmR family transcriptional regulator